jgi:hypothetical protein
VLTDEDFIEVVEAKDTRRDDKIAATAARKKSRKAIQSEKDAFEDRWKALKVARKLELAAWVKTTATLKEEGVPKAQWPAKPKAPRKAELSPTSPTNTSTDAQAPNPADAGVQDDLREDEEGSGLDDDDELDSGSE